MNQLAILDPKTYVSTAYQPFNEALENAIAKLPELVIRDISTKEGMTVAKQGRALFRDIRISLEKKRAEVKAPILEIGKLLDSRAKEIFAKIEPLEDKFSSEIKAEEERVEAIKAEKIRLENERQAALQVRIDIIRNEPSRAALFTSEQIDKLHFDLMSRTDCDSFEERKDEAIYVLNQTLSQLEQLSAGKKAQEQLAAQQEAARLEAERKAKELDAERIAEQKRQEEELKAERAKLAAEKAEIARQMAEIAAHKAAELAKQEAEKRFHEQQEAEAKRKESTQVEIQPVAVAITQYHDASTIEPPCPTPIRSDLIKSVAEYFDVDHLTAEKWLVEEFSK